MFLCGEEFAITVGGDEASLCVDTTNGDFDTVYFMSVLLCGEEFAIAVGGEEV